VTNGRSKLSGEAVKYIREERKAGVTARALTKRFDVTTMGIYYAAAEGWRHVHYAARRRKRSMLRVLVLATESREVIFSNFWKNLSL
jgi:hypothetical protein